MKRIFTFLITVMLLGVGIGWADSVEYVHPKKDVLSGECTVTSEGVVYQSMLYPSDPPTYYGGYVKFTAEDEGSPLTINFSEFNCLRNGNPVVFVYDGDAILKESFKSYNSAVPAGYIVAVRPENANTDYVAESGVLCVLYAPASKSEFVTSPSGSISGQYVASVSAGTPKNMEYVSATATTENAAAWRGAKNVELLNLLVKMDGSLNPLTLDQLSFNLTDMLAAGKVDNLRLYAGSVDEENLLAALAEGESTLQTSNHVLKVKNNFLLVGDIHPDATGDIPVATVSDLKIADEVRSVDLSAASDVTIANEIRMGADGSHITYTVSEASLFYDAGGVTEKIPVGAEGTLTFVPATEGQKIQVDITSLKLFDTSSTGNNDVLRFYNGRTVNDANLVADLLKETKVVKSTADDGSLTVYFKSIQGNESGRKDGWEATVSQFTPVEMTVAEVEGVAVGIENAFAGEKDVPMVLVNVKTVGQLNSLNLSEISVACADASAIKGVKLYALGETADFTGLSSSKLVAETSDVAATTTLSGDKALLEGVNWFVVTADIAENLTNDASVALKLASVKVGDTVHTSAEEASAAVTISNVCEMSKGTHSHTIYGEWSFKSPVPEYSWSDKYPEGTDEYVVTFIPSDANAKVQLEFNSFDVVYSSTSYGTQAVFEVYSGETTEVNNLIWKLSEASQATTGPGRKLRSTAKSGAMTIRFNANASSSYYCGTGWDALISQFVDHEATVQRVTVTQASTSILAPGATDAELLNIVTEVEGSISPLTLEAVNLELTGKGVINAVKVLVGESADVSKAVLWGAATMPAEGAAVKVARSEDAREETLVEEKNYMFVVVDIVEALTQETMVDAKLVSLEFAGGKTVAVENGNPEGVRPAKNIYLLEAGEGHVVTVSAPIMFYDDGGPEGNVMGSIEGIVTFVPAEEGMTLQLDTESFGIGGGKMKVYSGREVNEANILGSSTGYFTTTGPSKLISKADDGSLTIYFKAASATSLRGFAMEVTPIKAVAIDIAAVEVTNATEVDVVRGSMNVPVACVKLIAEGTSSDVQVKGLTIDFSGSTNVADILGAQVFYTGTLANFTPTNAVSGKITEFAEGVATIDFTSPVKIDEAGTYNFWIAADLSNTAEPGNMANVALTAVSTSGNALAIPENNSGSCTMVSGMGGTYRIGSSAEAKYSTIQAAVKALALGVEDAVTFQIEDGDYPENLSIEDVAGTSAEHPVVFTSLSGNRDAVRITGGAILENQGMVYVDNSSYIEFRNITIAAQTPVSEYSTKPFAALHFKNGSRHCVVDNCVITAQAITSSSSTGTSVIRTQDGNDENTNCDYLTISNCYVEGGFISLYLGGTGFVSRAKDTGLTVKNNTIVKPYSKAMYICDCSDFTIQGNTVTSETLLKSSSYLIDIYRPLGSFVVNANRVYTNQSVSLSGIYLRGSGTMGSTDPAKPALVTNNVVSIPNVSETYTYGVMLETTISNVLFAHNTISLKGATSTKSVYALAFNGKAPAENGVKVMNNIIQSTIVGGALRPWNDTHYANIEFSGNVYYGGGDVLDCDSKTFEEYQTATGDATSLWQQVQFLSDTDLHLMEAGDELAMPRLDAVLEDADASVRSESTTAGAYQYAPVEVETPEIVEGYPAVGTLTDVKATVKTRWTVGGSLYAICQTADAAAPDKDALLAETPVVAEADKEVTVTFSNLIELTQYKAYFLMVSALNEESAIVESAPFITKETIYPLEVALDWDETPYDENASISIPVVVTGGKTPYTYEWTDKSGEVVGSDDVLSITASANNTYRVTVTSADKQTATVKANVTVNTQSLILGSFDDLALEPESYWRWDELQDASVMLDMFFTGSFRLGNFPWRAYEAWSGYAYANETSTEFSTFADQFRNVVGGGAEETANYGVCYMYGADTRIDVSTTAENGVVVPGIYVTNSAYTLNSILNGDGYCNKFTEENGDYMTLVITGLAADRSTVIGQVEVSLADFRRNAVTAADNVDADSRVLTSWKWVDLSSLGAVKCLKLSYQSSQQTMVPAYVCIDQIGAANQASGIDAVNVDAKLSVSDAAQCICVSGVSGAYTLQINSVDGVLRASHHLSGEMAVGIADLAAGTYIAQLVAENGTQLTLKFVKR